jgi:DNA-binding NtrC family response regulator
VTGTLILEDVAALSRDQQTALLQWLEDVGRSVQIIATDTEPVFPLVEKGRFLDALYYRLNTVLLDLRPGPVVSLPEG